MNNVLAGGSFRITTMDAGNITQSDVSGLTNGALYYFAVSA
jgi:uncharacterized protein (UPF0303 family)